MEGEEGLQVCCCIGVIINIDISIKVGILIEDGKCIMEERRTSRGFNLVDGTGCIIWSCSFGAKL